jgi:hypothetical protein
MPERRPDAARQRSADRPYTAGRVAMGDGWGAPVDEVTDD